MFRAMLVEDNPALRGVLINNFQSQFSSMNITEAATRCKANHFFSKGSIATGEIIKLVKTIVLEKGFNADGSDSKKGDSQS